MTPPDSANQPMMAMPVLDRGGASDRLRNHLRRRAITRVGLIEGDLYMIPFYRAEGRGPAGEDRFYLLAAELGDSRLHRPNLLPADIRPFDAAALPPGTTVVRAEADPGYAVARGESLGWRADRLAERIHYPFWNMRIEDSGRTEGAWIDGIEGRLSFHALKVPPPIPSLRELALAMAPPAVALAIFPFVTADPVASVVGAVAVGGITAIALHRWVDSRARREREG